jgi:hypothetical protein
VISGISTTPNTVCKKEHCNAEDRSKYATQIVNNFDPFVMLPKTTNLRFGSFGNDAFKNVTVSKSEGFNGMERDDEVKGSGNTTTETKTKVIPTVAAKR